MLYETKAVQLYSFTVAHETGYYKLSVCYVYICCFISISVQRPGPYANYDIRKITPFLRFSSNMCKLGIHVIHR